MRNLLLALFLGFVMTGWAQTPAKPKLVVGIVVDQMRWDFLYRYQDRYGTGGFKRLLGEGFSCENAFIPYTPTYTAAGHACVYTGSTPALNGIAGNFWFDKRLNRNVYCTEDSTVKTVGSSSTAGEMSPRNMWGTSIADELRLSTNFRSKVIGISLKDRGSILPAGHSANGAFWFDNTNGGWITSTHYMQTLPAWMQQLNAKKLPDAYMAKPWTTLYPLNTYVQSTADDKPYEGGLPGEDNSFPHRTDTIKQSRYESFRYTPGANTFTFDAARAAIEGEGLGSRGVTDLLALSFSTPDYAGHAFGPNSIELEDMYLRLDKNLADFLTYLDTRIGKGGYLVFLTADHGVAHIPRFSQENKLPGGVLNAGAMQRTLNAALQAQFGPGNYILSTINYQVYLNNETIAANKADRAAVKQRVIETLLQLPAVARAVDLGNISAANLPQPVAQMLANGYHQHLSGDVQFLLKPGWFDGGERGTTHGSWNPYDAHIPLVWFGWGVKAGKSNQEVYMTDIAPTLAALLQIQAPSASIGKVIPLNPPTP